MTFLIEALGLTAGGGKTGLLRLLPALAAQGRRHHFVAVLADLDEFRSLQRPNLKLVLRRKSRSLLGRHLHLQRTIPQLCAENSADALLCLGNFGPSTTVTPTVVFLHNAEYVRQLPVGSARRMLRQRLIARYARHYLSKLPDSAHLVVQTDVMKRLVTSACGIRSSKVTVICDGDGLPSADDSSLAPCAADFNRPSERSVFTDAACKRQTPSPPDSPFTFLCLARYYPHKNLEIIPEAMKHLRALTSRPARCLITIDPHQHRGARKLLRRIEGEHVEADVVNLGALETSRVLDAYRSADAFVLPSLLESFGRTYLEAIRFDLPILTSDRDFAHEVCGGAAVYFDPLDPESIARCMARVMEDRELCDGLAAERRRIRNPSWDEIAARFVDVLEKVAREGQLTVRASSFVAHDRDEDAFALEGANNRDV